MKGLERQRDLDSLQLMAGHFLEATLNKPKSIYTTWAKHYFGSYTWREKPDSALQLLKEAHLSFEQKNEFEGIIKSAFYLGVIHFYYANDLDQSTNYFMKGLDLLDNRGELILGDSLSVRYKTMFLNSLSSNTADQGDYETAAEQVLKAMTYLEEHPNDRQKALCLMNLANIYASLKDYKKSIQYNKILLKLSEEIGDQRYYSMALNNVAAGFGNTGELDSAVVYLEKAYQISKKEKIWDQVSLRAANIGFTYQKLEQRDLALKYYQEALEIGRAKQLPKRQITALHFLANYYMEEKQTQGVEPLLLEANKLIEQGGRTESLLQNHDLYHGLYTLRGDYRNGLKYYKKMTHLRDSLRSEKVATQVADLESKYLAAEKEKENLRLRKEAELASLKITQRNIVIGLLVGLFSLISLIIFLLGRQKALKEQKQSIINAQRLRRAQMNPHFFFNALTSIQSLILDSNDKQKQLTYIGRFASLMRQTLEQSFQDFIPLEAEIESLDNYLKLQQLRFEGLFDYKIDYNPEDLEEVEVPSQLVQSLIENSIEHGFRALDRKGHIHIRFLRQSEDTFRIEVEDNGKGLNASTSAHLSRSQQIIQDRLRLFKQPARYFFNLENLNEKGQRTGVKATILAPYQLA
ncbi:MAG: hypothetical protein Sapg2KO_01660 [Saprospiraceae bacterium]